MASEVDICNLALAHLGDEATIASLKPPEGSAQAEHASRFYPIARDTLLEMHTWSFASKRASMASYVNNIEQWDYAYAVPADLMTATAVISPDAGNDYSTTYFTNNEYQNSPSIAAGTYVPQPYALEVDATGNLLIYTNQEKALLRYQAKITDTTKFPPLFIEALSWHLAGMLAGPVIKGDAGAAESKRCNTMMAAYLIQAKESDARQRVSKPEHVVPWVTGR
jgi:hypothetical protein